MKLRITSLMLLAAVMAFVTSSASAKQPVDQRGGAAGVVAAVVQAAAFINVTDSLNNNDVALVELNNSLNNLTALNNVLNNSPILNNNNIEIDVISLENFLNDADIDVTVQDILQNFLNNNQDLIDAIVGVGILNGGLVIFNQ